MKISVLGVQFDQITREEALQRAQELLDSGSGHYVVTPNPEIVEICRASQEAMEAVNGADLVLPDGIGIIYGARLLGTPLKERVPGIEFGEALLSCLARRQGSVFLLGAKPGVAEKAGDRLAEKYPGLQVVGTADGYFREDAGAAERVRASGADVVFVCLGAPKQELWMHRYAKASGAKLLCGLGGALDVFSGQSERAPEFYLKHNLEWLYRVMKEPRRLGRAMKLPLFLWHVWRTRERKK